MGFEFVGLYLSSSEKHNRTVKRVRDSDNGVMESKLQPSEKKTHRQRCRKTHHSHKLEPSVMVHVVETKHTRQQQQQQYYRHPVLLSKSKAFCLSCNVAPMNAKTLCRNCGCCNVHCCMCHLCTICGRGFFDHVKITLVPCNECQNCPDCCPDPIGHSLAQ